MSREKYGAVCFGEILWDVLPSGEMPGGAPMNVAYHLQKLGMSTALISKVGDDIYGQRLLSLLKERNLATGFIQIDQEHSTGLVKASIGENHEVSYDIIYPVAWDFIEWSQKLQDLVSQAAYFIYGSLAMRNEISRNTFFKLKEAASRKVLDINLRTPHFSKELVKELLDGVDILKLNENELPLIAGWFGPAGSPKDSISFLQDQFKIPVIIVTMGGRGALLNVEGSFFEHQGYKVEVADTVGSGDAFLAGFIFKLSSGMSPHKNLAFANALGAFIATQNGACPHYDLEEVIKLM